MVTWLFLFLTEQHQAVFELLQNKRRKKMKKFGILFCSVFLVFLLATGASAITFDFTGGPGGLYHNYTFTGSDGSTVFADEYPADRDLYWGSYGLGVFGPRGDDTQVDGDGTNEGVIFTFGSDVRLVSVDFAWVSYNDDFSLTVDGALLYSSLDIPSSDTYTFLGTYIADNFMIGANYNNDDFYISGMEVAPVPEPGTIVLMGLGLVGLAGMGRKKLFKK
jgi:hypothetical protein